jgi:hypothetical protein
MQAIAVRDRDAGAFGGARELAILFADAIARRWRLP